MQDIFQLLGVLMGTGLFQKHVLTRIPNNTIPYVQVVLGALGGHVLGIGAANGALVGASAVGAHQAIKIPVKGVTGKSL